MSKKVEVRGNPNFEEQSSDEEQFIYWPANLQSYWDKVYKLNSITGYANHQVHYLDFQETSIVIDVTFHLQVEHVTRPVELTRTTEIPGENLYQNPATNYSLSESKLSSEKTSSSSLGASCSLGLMTTSTSSSASPSTPMSSSSGRCSTLAATSVVASTKKRRFLLFSLRNMSSFLKLTGLPLILSSLR